MEREAGIRKENWKGEKNKVKMEGDGEGKLPHRVIPGLPFCAQHRGCC